MKKLILALSLTASLSALAHAGNIFGNGRRGVPVDQTGNSVQKVDYVGVNYSTASFTSAISTVTYSSGSVIGQYVIYGVSFTTGVCGDRVDLWDSTSVTTVGTAPSINSPTLSVYNVYGSTTNANYLSAGTCGGFVQLPWPIRFVYGLFYKPSSALYNNITVFYKPEE